MGEGNRASPAEPLQGKKKGRKPEGSRPGRPPRLGPTPARRGSGDEHPLGPLGDPQVVLEDAVEEAHELLVAVRFGVPDVGLQGSGSPPRPPCWGPSSAPPRPTSSSSASPRGKPLWPSLRRLCPWPPFRALLGWIGEKEGRGPSPPPSVRALRAPLPLAGAGGGGPRPLPEALLARAPIEPVALRVGVASCVASGAASPAPTLPPQRAPCGHCGCSVRGPPSFGASQ